MNIVVLDRAAGWHVADLKRAAGERHQLQTASFTTVAAGLGELSGDSSPISQSNFLASGFEIADVQAIIARAMPLGSLEQVVFRMDWLAQIETQFGVLIVNPAKSVEACVDKYLSLERIRAIRIPVPATFVCQSAAEAMRFFRDAARDCVVKPIFGSRGRNIARVKTESQALTLFEQLESQGKVIYQQRYIEHGDRDLRLLVIGNQLVSMVRRLPGSWITNASLGAHCTPHTANELERSIAWRAADSVGAVLAGIDLVYDQNGNPFVVEINASPSWRAISKATATDVASMLIQWMEKKVQ